MSSFQPDMMQQMMDPAAMQEQGMMPPPQEQMPPPMPGPDMMGQPTPDQPLDFLPIYEEKPLVEDREIDVKRIKLNEEKKQELIAYLTSEITAAAEDRSELESKWKTWLAQWDGRLLQSEGQIEGFRSRLDYNITREKGTHARARIINNIISQDPIYVTRSRKDAYKDVARKIEDFLDFALDQFDFEQMMDEWIGNAQVYSYGILKVGWEVEEAPNKRYEYQEEFVESPITGQLMAMPKMVENDVNEVIFEGVKPKPVRVEDFYFPYQTGDIQKSPWIAERIRYSEDDIKRLIDRNVFDDVLDELEETDTDSLDTDIQSERDEKVGVEPSEYTYYEVFETYLTYDPDDKGRREIIVSFDLKSGTILRVIENYYHRYKRPYLAWQWERRHGSLYGISFCQILEPIHRAISTSMNQRIDAATLANSINLQVQPSSSLAKKYANKPIPIGRVLEADAQEGIKPVTVSQPYSQLPELEQMLMAHADKLVGITDYMQGIESINRPTASGQQLLVEEGKQPLYAKLTSLRSVLSELAYVLLARYRQFFPDGIPYYKETPEGQMITEKLQLPSELIDNKVIIEIKASSSSLNKGVRKQEILGLLDRMQGVYQMLMSMMQGMAAPPPMGPMIGSIIDAYQNLLNQVLQEFDIGKPETINPPLKAMQAAIQQMMQMMQQQMMQQMQGGPQQGQPPGPGGPQQGGPPQGPPPQGGM